jgi:hypothetical protein
MKKILLTLTCAFVGAPAMAANTNVEYQKTYDCAVGGCLLMCKSLAQTDHTVRSRDIGKADLRLLKSGAMLFTLSFPGKNAKTEVIIPPGTESCELRNSTQ